MRLIRSALAAGFLAGGAASGAACSDDSAGSRDASTGTTGKGRDAAATPADAAPVDGNTSGAMGITFWWQPMDCARKWYNDPNTGPSGCSFCQEANCCEELNRCGDEYSMIARAGTSEVEVGCPTRFGCIAECLESELGPAWAESANREAITACVAGCGGELPSGLRGLPANQWATVVPTVVETFECVLHAPGVRRLQTADGERWWETLPDAGATGCAEQCEFWGVGDEDGGT